MPVASKHRFAAGPAQPHAPMPLKAQPVEGLIDRQKSGTGNDAASRRPMKTTGTVTKKSGISATAKVAVPPPVPRRTSRGKH